MFKRVLTALAGLPVLFVIIYTGGVPLQILLLLLVTLGLYEFSKAFTNGAMLDYILLSGLSFLLVTYSGIDGPKFLVWVAAQTIYYLFRTTFLPGGPLASAHCILGVIYVAGLNSSLWLIRHEYGFLWIAFGILVTWVTDTCAFMGGSKFGKHKLAAHISPKKTIEGAVIGALFGMGVGVTFALFVFNTNVLLFAFLALVLSVSGQIGDLAESAMKRERAIKDSGRLFPGHGGFLDRFDSLAVVMPLLYIIITVLF